MLPVICYAKLNILGPKGTRCLLMIRSFIGLLGVLLIYFGIQFIPPSDCSAIANCSIVITAILSRIFLKEKLGIPHIIALFFTIAGVVFISKPSILFSAASSVNATENLTKPFKNLEFNLDETLQEKLGIFMVILAAFFFGVLAIIIKKLCNDNVHWSVNTLYSSYTGVPACALLSVLLYIGKLSHLNLQMELPNLPYHVFYSSCSAFFGIAGQVFLNISLSCEDATKVSIAKTSDVFFNYVFQQFFLYIVVDMFSIIGSVFILLGTFIVLSFKILEKNLNSDPKKSSCCKKCFFVKF